MGACLCVYVFWGRMSPDGGTGNGKLYLGKEVSMFNRPNEQRLTAGLWIWSLDGSSWWESSECNLSQNFQYGTPPVKCMGDCGLRRCCSTNQQTKPHSNFKLIRFWHVLPMRTFDLAYICQLHLLMASSRHGLMIFQGVVNRCSPPLRRVMLAPAHKQSQDQQVKKFLGPSPCNMVSRQLVRLTSVLQLALHKCFSCLRIMALRWQPRLRSCSEVQESSKGNIKLGISCKGLYDCVSRLGFLLAYYVLCVKINEPLQQWDIWP